MNTARWITADVFDGLATLEDGSVDLVVTSPPFLALRSYLPVDHPEKSKEIGSESTPAEFIDVMLEVTAELRRVLAPHGSICIELGDTYAGSGGAGGDYNESGWREGQEIFEGSAGKSRVGDYERLKPRVRSDGGRYAGGYSGGSKGHDVAASNDGFAERPARVAHGWPLAKSRALIPQLYEIALAYGINPLTGQPSPAGQWRIRNVVTYCRPNPPVGALGDKWRNATSDLIVACSSSKRYWDDLATRRPFADATIQRNRPGAAPQSIGGVHNNTQPPALIDAQTTHAGAPLLDYWEIPPGGYRGAHYAVFPEELVVPCVKAMCPPKVCRVCGEPSRRIVSDAEYVRNDSDRVPARLTMLDGTRPAPGVNQHLREDGANTSVTKRQDTLGFTDCGHNDYRPGLVLDPFVGSGTTLAVATGHGYDAIGIDLDSRNLELARQRVGMFLTEPFDHRGERE